MRFVICPFFGFSIRQRIVQACLQDSADILMMKTMSTNAGSCGPNNALFCFRRGTGKPLRETDQWGFCLRAYLKHLKET